MSTMQTVYSAVLPPSLMVFCLNDYVNMISYQGEQIPQPEQDKATLTKM